MIWIWAMSEADLDRSIKHSNLPQGWAFMILASVNKITKNTLVL